MKKLVTAFVALTVAIALVACGTVEAPNNPRDNTPSSQFFTLVTTGEYEDSEKSWGWSDTDPLTEAAVRDELTFVFGYLRGTYRVELNEWNWNMDNRDVSVSGLPLVFSHDEGDVQTVRTFEWSPEHEGEYHFTLWLSDQGGQAREGAPIELVVVVGDHGDDEDPEPEPDPDPDPNPGTLMSWVNATINGRVISENEDIRLSSDEGISFNWGARSSATSVVATVVNDGREVYRSTASEHSEWLSRSDLRNGTTVFRIEARRDGKTEVQSTSFRISGSTTTPRPPDPAPPPLSSQINWFDATHNGSLIGSGREVTLRSGDGISFNWSVNSSVDRVSVSVRSDGREVYSSSSRERSEWLSFSRLYDGEVVYRITLEDAGRTYVRTFRFWVRKSTASTPNRGTVTFDLRTPSGYSDRDVRLRIYDSDGYSVDTVRDGDELYLAAGWYEGVLIESDTFTVSSASLACSRNNSRDVEFRVARGDDVTCRVNFAARSTSPDPTDAPASVWYNGREYTGLVTIPLYGNNFEIRWEASRGYDSVYVQLYKVGQADFFQSSERTGSRSFDPSSLGVGDYILRLNQYVDGRNDLVTVNIKIQ